MSNDIENPHGNIRPVHAPQTGPKDMPNQSQPQSIGQKVTSGIQSWKQNADFRMKICNTCPHYAAPRCKLCGCFMIAKTKIPQARCPAGKW